MSWDDENFEELKHRVGQIAQRLMIVGNYVGIIRKPTQICMKTNKLEEFMAVLAEIRTSLSWDSNTVPYLRQPFSVAVELLWAAEQHSAANSSASLTGEIKTTFNGAYPNRCNGGRNPHE